MKKAIQSCFVLLLLAGAGNRANAQCSAQGASSANCSSFSSGTGGQGYQEYYYITAGIPVDVDDELEVFGDGGCSVEVDIGPSIIWTDQLSTYGTVTNSTSFTGAQNSTGQIYLFAGAGGDSYAYVEAIW